MRWALIPERTRCVLLAAIAASAAGAGPALAQTAPPPGATVDSLLAAAHRLSPTLRAAALDTAAAAAKADAAGTLPDPSLSNNYQNYHSPGLFSMDFLMVSQQFPLWGKRGLEHRAALADVDAARGRERAAADALDEQLKVAFAQYYAATRAMAVTRDIIAVAHRIHGAALARYGQGAETQASAIQTLSDETSAETDLARLEGERASVKARMNALLARPADAPLAEPVHLPALPRTIPPVRALLARARSVNPTLSTSNAEIAAAQNQRELAKRAWYPDVTVAAGPILQTNAPTGFSATIGFSIPFLQGGAREAGEREADARLAAARQRLDATAYNIQGALGEEVARLDAARRIDTLLSGRLLPEAHAGFRSAMADYAQGRGDLGAPLAAEMRMHNAEIERLRTQTDEQTALAAIERLIGGKL